MTAKDRDVRIEQAYRRLGTRNPKCGRCEETAPLMLTGQDPDILCYTCRKEQQGQPPVEQHHVAGRHNDAFTVPTDPNTHRVLSDAQRDWPERTLRNPDQSPLLQAAAAIRGFVDWLLVMVERCVKWIPPFLESLDARLTVEWGPHWWEVHDKT